VRILVLNAGSSSLKFQLIDTDGAAIAESRDRRLARGVVERIGGQAIVTLQGTSGESAKSTAPIRDHSAAVEHVIAWLTSAESGVEIDSVGQIEAVGHRVVHGGERFTHSTRIDDTVRRELEDLIELAPLHNPHNLRGIAAARAALGPGVPQVAIFDTEFHHSLAPIHRVPLPAAHRTHPRSDEDHHAASRQWRVGLRGRRRQLRRHVDGIHAARGIGDGHPLG